MLEISRKTPANKCDRCHELDSVFVKTTDGMNERILCVDCLIDLINLKKIKMLNDKFKFQSFVLKSKENNE